MTAVAAASVAQELMVGGVVEAGIVGAGDRDDVVHDGAVGDQAL